MAHVSAMSSIRELDLSSYDHHGSAVPKINAVSGIPGLKTSTAFFLHLRTNLTIDPGAISSNANTPMLEPTSSMLEPPSPAPLATKISTTTTTTNPVPRDLPYLTIGVLHEERAKVDALQLVADSIAQQQRQAASYLIFHPCLLAPLLACLFGVLQYSWRLREDLGLSLVMLSGLVMAYLLAIRYVTSPYIQLAEDLKWEWMVSEDGEEDTVVSVRWGDEPVGALLLRLNRPNRKRHRAASRGGKGVIRAWTVKTKYRNQGIGYDLLREAVKITRDKCGRDATVGFAVEHANSARVLPERLNGLFRKGEQRAARALDRVIGERRRR